MVDGYNKNLTSSDSKPTPDRQSSELTTWIRSLQQALTVEVDHGFTNIQGRTNKFSYFVSGYLLSGPSTAVNEFDFSRLQELALDYEKYQSMSTDDRRKIIAQSPWPGQTSLAAPGACWIRLDVMSNLPNLPCPAGCVWMV